MAAPKSSRESDSKVLGRKRKKSTVNTSETVANGSDNHDSEESESKAKAVKLDYSSAEFKVELKDPNTSFKALERFVAAARAWTPLDEHDIVKNYCSLSAECDEIFLLLESTKHRPAQLRVIFNALECVLLRTADDLDRYRVVGMAIVRRLLRSNMVSLHTELSAKSGVCVKSGLKLLSAMIAQGDAACQEVLALFDFSSQWLQHLLNRRNLREEQDVRVCYLHVVLAFLVAGDNGVIRASLEHPRLLAAIFPGLLLDRADTVHLVLTTVREKIVENLAVSKTAKVRLFTASMLAQLVRLYGWTRPVWNASQLADGDGNDGGFCPEGGAGDQELVHDTTHEFLLRVCCSYKYGVAFRDSSLGTAARNNKRPYESAVSITATSGIP
ncbi:PREDICTED: nucleolar pre-ribosomal-associated protein 1-like [Priapulus caudatus]|uniref:Nucleolar pre-ribosomal-associated protein 1-like n=1 Tax=Priapulus caudatus TaxID=37621 RepID=A0ABM1EZ29_PRICU|nr:PREDICTED: nucleolar pre-ribosomal-associated protein 1-like [Priapulus caudatus]